MDDFDSLLEGVSSSTKSDSSKAELESLKAENRKLLQKLEAGFSDKGETESGRPMMVPIQDVIEDPDKPNVRQTQNPEFEEWLTENIKQQVAEGGAGIQDPISVRWSEEHQKWIINKGHTRRRCGEKAGLKQVPVIVQDASTDWNGVIENLIREGLSTKDMVAFIAAKKKEGITQKEIAKRLSRDTGWVSKHAALANVPGYIQTVWDNEYATDFTVLYELLSVYKKYPEGVEKLANKLISDKGYISKEDVAAIRKTLEKPKQKETTNSEEGEHDTNSAGNEADKQRDATGNEDENPEPNPKAATQSRKALLRLQVTFEGQNAFLLMQAPSDKNNLVLELASGGVVEVPVPEVSLIGVVEADS